MPNLTLVVPWSHALLREVLRPGDAAVDLTAGEGRDTQVLADAVGPAGRVVAFDVQAAALKQAAAALRATGCTVVDWMTGCEVPATPGVYLVHACHSTVAAFVTSPIRAAVANLGYLPGGDSALTTRPETTCRSLQGTLDLLLAGGRLAVTVYPGHPGGDVEAAAVDRLFAALPCPSWQVLRVSVANAPGAPYLLVAEKRSG
ncbi:MAG: rRNA methyltransferase [Deltaproteobacteria bacterium]|nr:MAG: rRNA methyltransferase [Deltaproteobacteria bacterium]